jgi:hypothetical protein
MIFESGYPVKAILGRAPGFPQTIIPLVRHAGLYWKNLFRKEGGDKLADVFS